MNDLRIDIQNASQQYQGPSADDRTASSLAPLLRKALLGLEAPIEDAISLGPEMYRSADVFALERKKLLRRNWISVCRVEDLAGETNCRSVEIADEKLFIVRKPSGETRALSRTCAHRWAELQAPDGPVQRFVCPNHAWVYDLDGALIGAPEMDAADIKSRFGCRLGSFACEVWQGWVFVNLDGTAPPLREQLGAVDAQIAPWRLADMKRIVPPIAFECAFNWKTVCENVGEAYHVIGVHKTTVWPSLDYTKSRWTYAPDLYCRSEFPTKTPDGPGLLGTERIPVPDDFCGIWAYNVFPCHIFSLSSDICVWQRLELHGEDKLRMEMHVLAPPGVSPPPELLEQLCESIRTVEQEDQDAFVRIARGSRSSSARPAPFCKHEYGTWAFQRWWAASMVS